MWIILSLYFIERNLSYIEIGIVFLLASTILSPLQRRSGKITDFRGRKPFALLVQASAAMVYLSMFLIVKYNLQIYYMFFALIVMSYLGNFQWSITNSIVTDSYDEKERTAAFSTFRVTSNAGIGVGLIFAGIFYSLSAADFFLVPVVASSVECLITALFLKETMSRNEIPMVKANEKSLSIFGNLGQYRTIILMSILFSVSGTIANQYETPATPIYFGTQWQIPIYFISALFAINTAVVVFFQMVITRVFSRYREHFSYAVGIFLYGIGYFIFAYTGYLYALATAIVILTVGESIISPIASTVISKVAPPGQVGEYFGINSFFSGIFRSASSIVGLGLLQIFYFRETDAYYTLFVLIMMVAVVSYFYLGNLLRSQKSNAVASQPA